MATYLNAYEILEQVRETLGEYDIDVAQGVDTATAFSNKYLMRKINDAQIKVYNEVFQRIPDEFLTSSTIVFTSSEGTMPWDCGKILELRDENGLKVHRLRANQSSIVSSSGQNNYYYQKGRTLVLDATGINNTYTIWYYKTPRELSQGRVTATGTTTITLDTSAKKIDDYYNNITIEDYHSDWVGTITDYTEDRVATVDGTTYIDDIYGTVSELPVQFHFLIPQRAVLDIKIESPIVKKEANQLDLLRMSSDIIEAINTYMPGYEDVTIESVVSDYSPYDNSGCNYY